MSTRCPACGNPATGRYCSQCGTALSAPTACASCGSELPPGGKFCNMCGKAAGGAAAGEPAGAPASPARSGGRAPLLIGGAAVLLAIIIVLLPRLRSDPGPAPAMTLTPAPPAVAGGDPTAVDLSSMTPRQAADRLFNRVMESVSAGDSVQARAFAPMAIAAYDRVPSLDLDGHYHVAVLHLVNDDPRGARDRSEAILREVPTHLFGLFTAAQAEQMLGDRTEAERLYRRFLDAYDTESTVARPEYADHAAILPVMREEAAGAVGA